MWALSREFAPDIFAPPTLFDCFSLNQFLPADEWSGRFRALRTTCYELAFRCAIVGALRRQHSLSLSPAPEEREAGSALPTLASPSRSSCLFASRLKALRATSTPSPSIPLLRSGKPEVRCQLFLPPLAGGGSRGREWNGAKRPQSRSETPAHSKWRKAPTFAKRKDSA
ncbi:MAG: hypothetical protein EBX40_01020 [Gammaproteobacteria bacterium]|nr:hypothetical protein [Gammaproteobacteria bacterium]